VERQVVEHGVLRPLGSHPQFVMRFADLPK
jgi:hypothetical protein